MVVGWWLRVYLEGGKRDSLLVFDGLMVGLDTICLYYIPFERGAGGLFFEVHL